MVTLVTMVAVVAVVTVVAVVATTFPHGRALGPGVCVCVGSNIY